MAIEIPDPPFSVEVDSEWHYNRPSQPVTHTAKIVVGRETLGSRAVVVFSREYTDSNDRWGEDDYASSEEDAKDKVLEAFGQRLKEVLA
jgi:hypothetical protein